MEAAPNDHNFEVGSEVPEEFQIFDRDENILFGDVDDRAELTEGQILYYERHVFGEALPGYKLLYTIGDHQYVFRCSKSYDYFSFDFKTIDHEYAVTDLTPEQQKTLGEVITSFIASIRSDERAAIDRLNVSPADASYRAKDMDACIEAILQLPNNELNETEIRRQYVGIKVFDYYRSLAGEDFDDTEDDRYQSRANARERLFRQQIQKYLPDWKIDDQYEYPGSSFQLIPKEEGDV